MTLRTLNYGNSGIFLIMGNAGFCPSTVVSEIILERRYLFIRVFIYTYILEQCYGSGSGGGSESNT